ncbi:hypothetical protein B5S32_g741 [[Candida] boidinii]|nr:hypothetical protein B5S32_g741 [[Candida] boidinii]
MNEEEKKYLKEYSAITEKNEAGYDDDDDDDDDSRLSNDEYENSDSNEELDDVLFPMNEDIEFQPPSSLKPKIRTSNLTFALKKSKNKDDSDSDSADLNIDNANFNKPRRASLLRRMSIGSIKQNKDNTNVVLNIGNEDYQQKDQLRNFNAGMFNKPTASSINDFKPITMLGQGAYGKVILVKQKNTDCLFALKELKKASISVNAKTVERTIGERSILSSISRHPNIVKLFYSFHDNEKLYLVLEYIPGGELFQQLAKQKFLNETVSAFYASQMALALKYLHEIGIVYRDLKPENCLLNSRGYLVLTDFGLSKEATIDNPSDFCSSIIGTPEYMAPEVLRGEDYGVSVDWWSLGAVIFDMCTGKPPFTGNNHKAISDKIIKQKIKYPFYLSNDIKDLLNKLLNKNVTKRLDVDIKWDTFKKHRFFRKIDWDKLYKQELEASIVPIITDLEKAENFDEKFTSIKLSFDENQNGNDSVVPQRRSSKDNQTINRIPFANTQYTDSDCFKGFSYTATESLIESYIKL